MEWLHVMKGRVHGLLHFGLHASGTAAMSAAKLRFSDRNPVATFKFAANATAMSSAIKSSSTSNLFATLVMAFFASSMLDTKTGRGLSRFIASFHMAPTPSAVTGAITRSTDGRLIASVVFASLSASVCCAEEFVSCSFITARKGASAPASMCNTKSGGALSTFIATLFFALAVTAMSEAVRTFGMGDIIASFDSAYLLRR
mmetsp:Transcript_17026/g.35742  ORF Transcript_17026/g.35742 Transcript_17026/m.35742 type:complete len:201 (+) Transcript_17026:183-785(+)